LQKAKSILEKDQKRVKLAQFWGQQVLFGTKFLKFGPKMANHSQPCSSNCAATSHGGDSPNIQQARIFKRFHVF